MRRNKYDIKVYTRYYMRLVILFQFSLLEYFGDQLVCTALKKSRLMSQ